MAEEKKLPVPAPAPEAVPLHPPAVDAAPQHPAPHPPPPPTMNMSAKTVVLTASHPFLRLHQSRNAQIPVSSTAHRMVPVWNGAPRVLTRKISAAPNELIRNGKITAKINTRMAAATRLARMNRLAVIFFSVVLK